MNAAFSKFVRDEAPALDQLRLFVGGQAGPALDCSTESLALLDAFVTNLTSEAGWEQSSLFAEYPSVKAWLTVRVAYYIGSYARRHYGSSWYLSEDADSPVGDTPVMAVRGIEFSPLEVAAALFEGDVVGGLVGFFADLETERLKRKRGD